MRVLIVGGTGFIGHAVCAEWVAGNHDVTVFHRGQAPTPPGTRSWTGDRDDATALRDVLERVQPDVVLHQICMTAAQAKTFDDVFADPALRRVVLSSADVYLAFGKVLGVESGPVVATPLTEDSPLRTVRYPYRAFGKRDSEYDKILVEERVLEHPRTTVIRLPMVFGEGDVQHRLHPYLRRMDDERPVLVLGESAARWRACRIHVADAARAIVALAMATEPPRRIYHVQHEHVHTEREWIEAIAGVVGWAGRIVERADDSLPEALRFGGNTEQSITLDSTAIRRDLGYEDTVSLEDRLASTIEWERANRPEPDPVPGLYSVEDDFLAGGRDDRGENE